MSFEPAKQPSTTTYYYYTAHSVPVASNPSVYCRRMAQIRRQLAAAKFMAKTRLHNRKGIICPALDQLRACPTGAASARGGAAGVSSTSSCAPDSAALSVESLLRSGALPVLASSALPHSTTYRPATTATAPNKLTEKKKKRKLQVSNSIYLITTKEMSLWFREETCLPMCSSSCRMTEESAW
jgi:hypothetical protein